MRSRHGAAGEVTAAQLIAEVACERVAARRGVELPARFWSTPSWDDTFRRLVVQANRLLKVFEAEAILAALDAEPAAYSLGSAWLKGRIAACQRILDAGKSVAAPASAADASTPPRPGTGRGGVFQKLRGLDVEKKGNYE